MNKKSLYETHHWHSGSIDINGPISMAQLQNVVFSEQRFIIFSGLIPFPAIFISSWGFWKNLSSPWFVFRLIKLSFAKNVFFSITRQRPVHCNLSWFTRTGSILVDYVCFAAKKLWLIQYNFIMKWFYKRKLSTRFESQPTLYNWGRKPVKKVLVE